LFFDELDSLAPRRGGEGNQASERVVNQLLTEMDGLESRSATFVVAATNRPDMIDPAMLRPGRLDKLLYVPLPPPDGRAAILKTLTRKTPLAPEVDVDAIAFSSRCSGFSGADLASLVREACVAALKGNMAAFARADAADKKNAAAGKAENAPAPPLVTSAHFDAAFARVQPSVSSADQRRYDELRRKLRKERGSIAAPGLDREKGANVSGSEGGMTLEPGPGEDGVGRRAGSAKKRKA
jgi:ribosome biogenesis ATPase